MAENGKVPENPAPMPQKPSDSVGAARHDLVLANRILADPSVGILDTSGHLSLRNPSNPNSYVVATAAPGSVTDQDIIERDFTKPGPDTMGLSIDDEIYKANPNVMAVLYAQTPEIVAFTKGVQLRPVVNGAAFIGDGLPVVNVSTPDRKQPLLSNPALGKAVAAALGTKPGTLLSGHGFVMTGRSIYNVVGTSYQLRQNARIQQQAMALRGRVSYLNERPVPPEPQGEGAANAGGGPQGGGGGRGGKITMITGDWQDLVDGMLLQMMNGDQSHTYASISMHDNRLYLVEGTAPITGYPPPIAFQQNFAVVDSQGNAIRYQRMYSNAYHGLGDYPAPPRAGRPQQ